MLIDDEGTGVGDRVAHALSLIGITDDRVSDFLGFPCGCKERREKLNMLESWARRVLAGKLDSAKEYLSRLIGESDDLAEQRRHNSVSSMQVY
jgi:hypothetical protein